jgi:hypothetical protein
MRAVWVAVAAVSCWPAATGFAQNPPPIVLPPIAPAEEGPLGGGTSVSRPLTPVEIPPAKPPEATMPDPVQRVEEIHEQKYERRGPLGPSWDGMELSCLVWELNLLRLHEPPAGLTLQTWASATAERVHGLMEPLTVYEVDETRYEAILRSMPPSKKGEALAYYEVHLTGLTSATVRRFTATRSAAGRTQMAFALTHEVLARLAGDIAG